MDIQVLIQCLKKKKKGKGFKSYLGKAVSPHLERFLKPVFFSDYVTVHLLCLYCKI